MSSSVDHPDTLNEVRHRAPALADSGVDYGLLTDLAGFSVKLVWILGHGLLAREIGDGGITPHRFSALEVIGRNPGLQQTQLAAALALTRPATTAPFRPVPWSIRQTSRADGRVEPSGASRGTSGLHRAGWWLTATRGDPRDSATENRPPGASAPGKGETVV